jgi:hypothetical protein
MCLNIIIIIPLSNDKWNKTDRHISSCYHRLTGKMKRGEANKKPALLGSRFLLLSEL